MNTPFCHTHGWAHADPPDQRSCRIEDWNTVPGIVIDSVEVEPEYQPFHVLGTGRLAYLNVKAGPVPVKITAVRDHLTRVEVTADRPGYDRGEVLYLSNPKISLLHRSQVSRRTHKISGDVRFINDEGTFLP